MPNEATTTARVKQFLQLVQNDGLVKPDNKSKLTMKPRLLAQE